MSTQSTSQVHAPYHFVPLSKWIYMPDWAHLVSHDVPFKDGYSGSIEYTLTNATPLCVGDKQVQESGKPTVVKWARDPNGNPVIPGSSLKGMIRSVLEIASFGKFSAIDDSHFSYRDVSSKSAYLSLIAHHHVQAGWIKFDTNSQQWTLSLCDYAKIKHSELNKALNKTISNDSDAVNKYQTIPLTSSIQINTFIKEGKQGKVTWAKDVNKGTIPAKMVFCNNRIKGMGQSKPDYYEFSYFFYNNKGQAQVDAQALNDKVNKFFMSHNEEQTAYLRNNPEPEQGIPVFALFEKNSTKLHSLGLAKMPRVLYKNAAVDLADQQQTQARNSEHYFDLSELMFGTLREKGLSLKSRVMFTDATLQVNKGLENSGDVTLNAPKATFRGAYLEQNNPSTYDDYNNKNAKLAGWKRYITQTTFTENPSTNTNVKVKSQLELLNTGSQFSGTLVFHNLKSLELGALLWAMQLGNQEQSAGQYHGLGHGKSLGSGAVQLSLKNVLAQANNRVKVNNEQTNLAPEQLITDFIAHMNQQHSQDDSGWQQSAQLQNLLAMTNRQANENRELAYMPLTSFKEVKNNKASLPPLLVNGEKVKRSETMNASGSLSFAKGRLAALCNDESTADTWFISEKNKQKRLIQKLAYQQEQAEKAAKAEQIKQQMAVMPEDMQQVMQLKLALESKTTVDEKRTLNADTETLINHFLTNTKQVDSAKLLYEIVSNKKLCEYLNITNKKKLKPRKQLLTQLVEKYQIKVKS